MFTVQFNQLRKIHVIAEGTFNIPYSKILEIEIDQDDSLISNHKRRAAEAVAYPRPRRYLLFDS
jgi:hypothetical protein